MTTATEIRCCLDTIWRANLLSAAHVTHCRLDNVENGFNDTFYQIHTTTLSTDTDTGFARHWLFCCMYPTFQKCLLLL
jgi:hypothetical protein